MRRFLRASSLAFLLGLVGQAFLEQSTQLPVAPARMLLLALGLIAAAPAGVVLIERMRGSSLPGRGRLVAGLGSAAAALGLLLTAVYFSGGPLGPIPGGRLRGTLVADPNPDWSVLDETRYVQLEMEGPRSVELVVVRVGRDAYVGANYAEWKIWPDVVAAHPDVRLRVGERLYDRSAVEITDRDESRSLLAALSGKYGFDVSLGTGVVRFFRLDPRVALPAS